MLLMSNPNAQRQASGKSQEENFDFYGSAATRGRQPIRNRMGEKRRCFDSNGKITKVDDSECDDK